MRSCGHAAGRKDADRFSAASALISGGTLGCGTKVRSWRDCTTCTADTAKEWKSTLIISPGP